MSNEPLQVSLKRAAFLLGCCERTIYRMRDANQIQLNRLRGRVLVPMSEIKRITAFSVENTIGHHVAKVEPRVEPKKVRPKKVKLVPQHSGA